MSDPQPAELSGHLPQPAAPFGTLPHSAEDTRNVPHSSAAFRTLPQHAERSEHHTLTVREVVRMFEDANVSRSERTIVSWCQLNRQGIAKLNSFFDTNERKYYITSASVVRAIEEELSKRPLAPQPSSTAEAISEERPPMRNDREDEREVKLLKEQIRDLDILNKTKDFYIERLQDERGVFLEEIKTYSYKVGSLETKLLQLDSPHISRIVQHDIRDASLPETDDFPGA